VEVSDSYADYEEAEAESEEDFCDEESEDEYNESE
jgi:hypothetical protein